MIKIKYFLATIILATLILCSAGFVSAQTAQTQASLTQQLIQLLTQLITQLQHEIAAILAQNSINNNTTNCVHAGGNYAAPLTAADLCCSGLVEQPTTPSGTVGICVIPTTPNQTSPLSKTYTNSQYGFSIKYPTLGYASVASNSSFKNIVIGWKNNSGAYDEGEVYINVQQSQQSNDCSTNFGNGTPVVINGINFIKGDVSHTRAALVNDTYDIPSTKNDSFYADEYCAVQDGFLYRLTSIMDISTYNAGASSSYPAPSRSDFENNTIINQVINSFQFTTNPSIPSTCIDSDGGLNYYVAGQASIPVNGPGHNPQFLDDSCNGNILTEAYCTANGRIGSTTYTCPNGCSNLASADGGGACKQSITQSSINIITPKGGEIWKIGETNNIIWSPGLVYIAGCHNFISLQDTNGKTVGIISNGLLSKGQTSFSWNTKDMYDLSCGSGAQSVIAVPGTYRIAVIEQGDGSASMPDINAYSNYFSITAQ